MKSLIAPIPLLLVLTAAALVRDWRRGGKPRCSLACGVLWLLVSWYPVSFLAVGTLEWQYSVEPLPKGHAEAIVVLSGAAFEPTPYRPIAYLGSDSYVRCRHAAWLRENWNAAEATKLPILACGGVMASQPGLTLTDVMKEHLEAEGVPPEAIWTESRSTTTFENALHAADILRARGIRRIALVTNGYHMPRAERCFRRVGLEVVPAPCGLRSARFRFEFADLIPNHHAIDSSSRAFHEWVGILWYGLSGKI